MERILHILKRNDLAPLSIIEDQEKEAQIEILLIQDAVSLVLPGKTVFALADDLIGTTDYPTLSYKDFLEKLFCADRVVIW